MNQPGMWRAAVRPGVWNRVLPLLLLLLVTFSVLPAAAQEMKGKAPLYIYVGLWNVPRAHWGEMGKQSMADDPILKQSMAKGNLLCYGNDFNLLHTPDGYTHDDWWCGTSMASLLEVLDQFQKMSADPPAVLTMATKHADMVLVSRFYGWKPGNYTNVYSRGLSYKLKHDAPDEAVELLSKQLFVPLLEKLMAEGSVIEYDVDEQALHTEDPAMFYLNYICPTAADLDKVNAAVREMQMKNPLSGYGFDRVIDFKAHRDVLTRTNASFK